MSFRFRQFDAEDQQSSMRIGTDAILLGAWADPKDARLILDIGTGCGVIALMLAQKCNARIDAIDIDMDSAGEAGKNFINSPWKERLTAIHGRFQDHHRVPYDLICTNPPWFRDSLRPAAINRSNARHGDGLSFEELVIHVDRLLAPGGRFIIILPVNERKTFTGTAIRHLLFVQHALEIIPVAGKPANRILIEFGRNVPGETVEEKLIIRSGDNSYTREYRKLTEEYYTGLQ